jgi:hypothetical protein
MVRDGLLDAVPISVLSGTGNHSAGVRRAYTEARPVCVGQRRYALIQPHTHPYIPPHRRPPYEPPRKANKARSAPLTDGHGRQP